MKRSQAQATPIVYQGRSKTRPIEDSEHSGMIKHLYFSGTRSAVLLTVLMAALIFVFEAADMYILHILNIESPWKEALADSLILLVLMTPALYWLLFKPFDRYVRIHKADEFVQSTYQRILKISNTSQDLDSLLQRYADELKMLTQCEIVVIRAMDWLGQVKLQYARSSSCVGIQDPQKCMTEVLQSEYCFQIMQELEESLIDYKTDMGSLYCPEITRMFSTLSKERVQQIVSLCPLDRVETLVLVPMVEKDVRLGFIQLADARPAAINKALVSIVEKSNLQVAAAIQRLRAEDGLRQTKKWLETRVIERTAMLTEANQQLNLEIAEQKRLYRAIEGYKRKLQSLSKQLLEEELQGRKQIATELHDRIGHNLALIKIKLGMLAKQVEMMEPNGHLSQIRDLINQTITDTRTLTFELSPPILFEIGLKSAIEWLVQQMERDHELPIQVVSRADEGFLDENQRFVLFRATRELLFNVIKHARAEKAQIIIRSNPGNFLLDIEDDGVGFDGSYIDSSSNESTAFGLFGIKERLGYLGGKLKVSNLKSGGARVTMQVPVNRETNDIPE